MKQWGEKNTSEKDTEIGDNMDEEEEQFVPMSDFDFD